MNKIYQDKWVTIYLSKAFNKAWLEFVWSDMGIPLEPNLIAAHTKALEVAVANNISTFMARIENAKKDSKLSDMCLTWWSTIWVKVLISKGIRRIITIHKTKEKEEWAMDRLKAQAWENPSKTAGIEGFDLDSYEEAWRGIV